MIDTIINLFTDGLSGGLFGVFGGLATAWLKYKSDKDAAATKLAAKKADQQHELAMVKATTDANIAEINAGVQRDRIIMEGKSDVAENETRSIVMQNYDKDTVDDDTMLWMMKNRSKWTSWLTVPVGVMLTSVSGFVDLMRKLVRPAITYGSVGFSFFVLWFSFEQMQKMGVPFDAKIWSNIVMDQLRLISFIASTAVSFWFTDKSMSRKFQDKTLI
jgi:hypothetical protein